MKKFSQLGIQFKKKDEIARLAAIAGASVLGIGTVLYFVDTGASTLFSLLFV